MFSYEVINVKTPFHNADELWIKLAKGIQMVMQSCIEQEWRTVDSKNNTTEPVNNGVNLLAVNTVYAQKPQTIPVAFPVVKKRLLNIGN